MGNLDNLLLLTRSLGNILYSMLCYVNHVMCSNKNIIWTVCMLLTWSDDNPIILRKIITLHQHYKYSFGTTSEGPTNGFLNISCLLSMRNKSSSLDPIVSRSIQCIRFLIVLKRNEAVLLARINLSPKIADAKV